MTYTATASGGNGNYSYTWYGMSCSGSTCAIDPPDATLCFDQKLSVMVSDTSGLCPEATSEEETYSKETSVTATNN